MKSLEKELSYRQSTVEQLEQSELFYDIQYGEAKIVANVSAFSYLINNSTGKNQFIPNRYRFSDSRGYCGWWRSIVVRLPVPAGELSLSCARVTAGRVTTLWVKRPLSVNQRGQLSQPSLWGRLSE